MSNLTIPFGPNEIGVLSFVGKDPSGTIRGLSNATAVLSDATNAYIANAANGQNEVLIVPKQNVGGPPLTAPASLTITVNGTDPVLGGPVPPIIATVDLLVAPPPPPHTTQITLQLTTTATVTTVPTDPGVLSVPLT